jgi:hypothetical protein
MLFASQLCWHRHAGGAVDACFTDPDRQRVLLSGCRRVGTSVDGSLAWSSSRPLPSAVPCGLERRTTLLLSGWRRQRLGAEIMKSLPPYRTSTSALIVWILMHWLQQTRAHNQGTNVGYQSERPLTAVRHLTAQRLHVSVLLVPAAQLLHCSFCNWRTGTWTTAPRRTATGCGSGCCGIPRRCPGETHGREC